jgi:hypothetical protein
MRRLPDFLAILLGGIILALLLQDPTRHLIPIFVLLALGVICAVLPRRTLYALNRNQRFSTPHPTGLGGAFDLFLLTHIGSS